MVPSLPVPQDTSRSAVNAAVRRRGGGCYDPPRLPFQSPMLPDSVDATLELMTRADYVAERGTDRHAN